MMNEFEERLQERLERLEAGEPLAVCLPGLPVEEAELLTLAATLRQAAYPRPDSETAVSQRAALQRLAQNLPPPTTNPAGLMARLLAWWQVQTNARRGLVTAAAALAVILVAVGLNNLVGPANPEPAADVASIETGSEQTIAQAPIPDSSQPDAAVPDAAGSAPVVDEPGAAVYIPLVSFPLDRRPETAVLGDIHGFVEIQDETGEWTAVSQAATLAAGQRLRTGAFSQASLTFYDGSQARIGPVSELSLDTVDAQLPENGFRTIVMTQWLGESEHDVQFRNDSGSRYEVKSPNGTGIARGTTFHVLVTASRELADTADLRARYTVSKGQVDVIALNVTVSVTAGQTSAISTGAAPTQPAFRVAGEGVVSQIGPEWVIGGQTFFTGDETVVVGNPQVGDRVWVEGHLLADGARLADRIILLQRTPANRFTITGQVDAIGVDAWTVAGQPIVVDTATDVEDGIVVGDVVQVDGLIQTDDSLLAERIRLVEANAGLPFEFTGVVQSINGDAWMISGVAITADADTEIKDEIIVGDVVKVKGRILADDTWLADEIKLVEDEESRFEITGRVDGMDPWIVAGLPFTTDDWTKIEAGIAAGDLVKVEGRILANGTWAANEIKLLTEEDQLAFEFYGTVGSIAPWVVSGITLSVTEETAVAPGIMVGDLVKVTVTILPDGSWLVVEIALVNSAGDDAGCFSVTAVVVSFSDNQLTVDAWPVFQLDDAIELDGQIQPGSIITLYACVDETGKLVVLDIILYMPAPVDVPAPPPPGGSGGKVTLCHSPNSKNPHTITVDQSAVQAHLNHGDTLGACP